LLCFTFAYVFARFASFTLFFILFFYVLYVARVECCCGFVALRFAPLCLLLACWPACLPAIPCCLLAWSPRLACVCFRVRMESSSTSLHPLSSDLFCSGCFSFFVSSYSFLCSLASPGLYCKQTDKQLKKKSSI